MRGYTRYMVLETGWYCHGTDTRGLGRLPNYKNSKLKKRERRSQSLRDLGDNKYSLA